MNQSDAVVHSARIQRLQNEKHTFVRMFGQRVENLNGNGILFVMYDWSTHASSTLQMIKPYSDIHHAIGRL